MSNLKSRLARYGYLGLGSASMLIGKAASAVTVDDLDETGVADDLILGDEEFDSVIIAGINWFLGFLVLIVVIIMIVGGIRWASSGGNPEKVEGARNMLIAGFIGLVIILMAWSVSAYVINNLLDVTGAG